VNGGPDLEFMVKPAPGPLYHVSRQPVAYWVLTAGRSESGYSVGARPAAATPADLASGWLSELGVEDYGMSRA